MDCCLRESLSFDRLLFFDYTIGAEEIVAFLDGLDSGPAVTESTVRGYKVKVTRQAVSPEELAGRRSAIAEVIARSLVKRKGKDTDE